LERAVKLRKAVGVVHRHQVNLHVAEVARECDLRRRRHVLRRKEQHLVAEKRVVNRAKHVRRDAARDLDTRDLGAELRRQRTYCEPAQIGGGIQRLSFEP